MAEEITHEDELCRKVAKVIADGSVVGWFQGRMEFGPRALGNRSILGYPRNLEMQKKLNLKIKFREGFHVDFSVRVQTVHIDTNPRFHHLIRSFREQTGYGLLVNTSFNVRGEPIVCTPEDAYKCFMRTEMDYLEKKYRKQGSLLSPACWSYSCCRRNHGLSMWPRVSVLYLSSFLPLHYSSIKPGWAWLKFLAGLYPNFYFHCSGL